MFHRRNETHAVTLAGMLGLFVVGGLAAVAVALVMEWIKL